MFVPTRDYGRYGFVKDTPQFQTPIAAWGEARNVRFKGGFIERALEPDEILPAPDFVEDVIKGQQFYDGSKVRLTVATASNIYLLSEDGSTWNTIGTGTYATPNTGWQSFPWGNTVVYNNGVDIPQVYNPTTGLMVNLPKWGIITADDGTPGLDTQAKCRVLAPYKSFLVAINVAETSVTPDDETQTNTVWWSDSYTSPDLWLDPGPDIYPWDYNSSTNLSGKNLVGMEDGPLTWALSLGEGIILYTTKSATQMLFVGGNFVMDFRRLFDYGCVGVYGASEYNNLHYVVGPDVMYVHDGNVVKQIAEDRVRDWFYGQVENLELNTRVVTDYSEREVLIQFDNRADEFNSGQTRLALAYNYEDDNYSTIDASYDNGTALVPVVDMVYGLNFVAAQGTEVAGTWDESNLSWDSYGPVQWSPTAEDIALFWLTKDQLFRANALSTPAPNKNYIVRKTNIDLDELNPQLTTNLWKHLRQMYPHAAGSGVMRVRFGWSPSLETAPNWDDYIDYPLNTVTAKVDTRTTGRYLAMEFRMEDTTLLRFSGADIDVLPVYGR